MCRAVELFGELVVAVLTLKKFPFLFNLETATAHANYHHVVTFVTSTVYAPLSTPNNFQPHLHL